MMTRFLTLLLAASCLTASAQCPNGEIAIDFWISLGSYPSEISWQLNDATGANVFTGGAGETGTWCLAPGDYTFIGLDSYGDGWNGAVAEFSNSGFSIGSLAVVGGQGSIVLTVNNDIPGCTDPAAANYNPIATEDDGTCCFDYIVTFNLYDAFGDGWTFGDAWGGIVVNGIDSVEFTSGSLLSFDLCFPEGCYTAEIQMGAYGNEASWEAVLNGVLINSGSGTGGADTPFNEDFFFYTGSGDCVSFGCNDATACNFDDTANINDGSCDYSCIGCIDPIALNYNPDATLDGGNCTYVGCTIEVACNFNPAASIDDGSCEFYCPGCTDVEGCNFDPSAIQDDGSCEYPETFYYCDGLCITDSDQDGVCDELEVMGCTDPAACNFNALATEEDGTCIGIVDLCGICGGDDSSCAGCIDPMACNYDSTAVWQPEETVTSGLLGIAVGGGSWDSEISWQILDDQGELILEGNAPFVGEIAISSGVYQLVLLDAYGDGWNGADMTLETIGGVQVFTLESGSMDTFTFSPAFGGVCEYPSEAWLDCNGNCLADSDDDGICDEIDPCFGVIDECGVCAGPGAVYECGCEDIPEGLCDCNGNELDECGVCGGDNSSCTGCTYEYACNYDPSALIPDASLCEFGTCPGCTDPDACNYNPTVFEDDGSCDFTCYGCTDPSAVNYDASAQYDDGSCGYEVLGCTDPAACNYDATATLEDNSCDFTCYGCSDPGACNFDGSDLNDGSCDYSCIGCTDSVAANYDPDATVDSGNCVYCDPGTFLFNVDMFDSFGNGWSGAEYLLFNVTSGALVDSGSLGTAFTGDGLTFGTDLICLAPGCYSFQTTTDIHPGEVSITLSDQFGTTYGTVGTEANYGIDFTLTGQCAFEGCTNPSSSNFNPSASVDDGTCDFVEGVVFNVDMTCFTAPGATVNGSTEYADVFVTGPWCGWCANDVYNTMTDPDGDGIYSVSVTLDGLALGDLVEYKYAINGFADHENLVDDMVDGATCAPVTDFAGYANRQIPFGNTANDIFGACTSCNGTCSDPEACNFDPEAEFDDGSCQFPAPYYDCLGNCLNDGDGDGVCDELEVPGCLEPNACNFNPEATEEAECIYIQPEDCDCDGNQLDALGICGGGCLADGDNDGVCDDVDPCVGTYDVCGVCNGPGDIYECGCEDIPAGDCDCDGNALDALGVCGGSCASDGDDDGVCDNVDPCVGVYDVCGVCNGPGAVYECGCEDIPAGDCDCSGNQLDALGVCGGLCNADLDADGVCDEFDPCVGAFDECGACNGPGASFSCGCSDIPPGDCDCFGNQLDALDVCGGSCAEDGDGDGICDDVDDCVGVIDECGVCNGLGAIYDCGCADIPEGDCDCFGNQMDLAGVCGGDCFDDDDMDGICDDIETYGCTYPLAENYDPNAMADDGSCLFPCEGAVNVNVFDWNQDGSITSIDLLMMLSVYGDTDADFDGVWDSIDLCVDLDACNYDNDPSTECLYLDALGNCGGDCDDDADLDNLCDDEDLCTDPDACNFDALPTEPCLYIDALSVCGGTCNDDDDGDGICDDVDGCVGVVDECGVCNGPGPTEVTIESITILYDSVFADQIQAWLVFEVGADTTFFYTCPPTIGAMPTSPQD